MTKEKQKKGQITVMLQRIWREGRLRTTSSLGLC